MSDSVKATGASIESRDDFKKTPGGMYNYWRTEIKASQGTLSKWRKQADRIVSRYLDARAVVEVKICDQINSN